MFVSLEAWCQHNQFTPFTPIFHQELQPADRASQDPPPTLQPPFLYYRTTYIKSLIFLILQAQTEIV